MGLIPWSTLKAFVDSKGLAVQWYDYDNTYYIYAVDGPLKFEARIFKDGGSEQTEFEASYKNATTANTPLWQYDTDGAQIVRNKAAKKGWIFCSLPFEFQTSRRSDSLYSKDSSGTDRSFITLKAYDASNNEVTTDGLLGANLATITKTVIDFEPPYDYEVIGGDIRTLTTISDDMRLWIVAVPDVPAPTGSKEMGGGINLRYLAPGNVWSVDGRVSKYATYNATYHTNKLRLILKYPAGVTESLQVIIQLYKAY